MVPVFRASYPWQSPHSVFIYTDEPRAMKSGMALGGPEAMPRSRPEAMLRSRPEASAQKPSPEAVLRSLSWRVSVPCSVCYIPRSLPFADSRFNPFIKCTRHSINESALSTCLSVCLTVCPSCKSLGTSVYTHVFPSCRSVRQTASAGMPFETVDRYVGVCRFVCLYMHFGLSVCRSVCPSVRLLVCLSDGLSVGLYTSVCIFFSHTFACQSVSVKTDSSVGMSLGVSVRLPVCLSAGRQSVRAVVRPKSISKYFCVLTE